MGPGDAGCERPAGAGITPAVQELVRAACGDRPVAGAIVLGSGLGVLLDSWEPETILAADAIPGYPASSVPGHAGRLAIVDWEGKAGLVFQGRVHFYEGFGRAEVTFAVRLAAALGAEWLILSNASGSVDPGVPAGSVLVIDDHIRLVLGLRASRGAQPGPCLRGSPYHARRSVEAFREISAEGMRVQHGVLFGGFGPTYESASEVAMIRRAGATVACMSTVIEAEEAARLGLEVIAISMVTNLATGLAGRPLEHGEVVAAAGEIGPRLARAIDRLVRGWVAGAPSASGYSPG
ncbi:MAG: purine-nucleoside phosphorylase [Candidatus Eisenbacteria sp.]|nr:purine-nucleoside phosphorylase [Candidatus Eisenbacteria bacterium]